MCKSDLLSFLLIKCNFIFYRLFIKNIHPTFLLDQQTNINTRYIIIKYFPVYVNLKFIQVNFSCTQNCLICKHLLFFRPIKLELIYNLNNIIRKKIYTETYINPDRQTDRDLIVFCLRFKISLDPFFSLLDVLICPRLRSQAKLAVYFKDMKRVNFKLFPRQAF